MAASERLSFLLKKYADNACTAKEHKELFELIAQENNQESVLEELRQLWEGTKSEDAHQEEEWDHLFEAMMEKHQAKSNPRLFTWKRLAAAAIVFLVAAAGLMLFNNKNQDIPAENRQASVQQEFLPGGNKAVLTLANGSKIVLDGKSNGTIIKQSGIEIIKTDNGQLLYKLSATKGAAADIESFNTIETPKGGQYQVTMPDGTRVWLNAMSSLKYPVHFSAAARSVTLEGEAYFEVSENKKSPFQVRSKGQVIEVLGTHFNVNAYEDESFTRTTLLEGSVRLNGAYTSKSTILTPGEQALQSAQGIRVNQVDAEQFVAWKNGNFSFHKDKLQDIMKQLSRWYDVEIIFSSEKAKQVALTGNISRFENASQVLDILALTGLVKFKVEGRRIIVM